MMTYYHFVSSIVRKHSVCYSLNGLFSDDDTKIVLTPGKLALIKLSKHQI